MDLALKYADLINQLDLEFEKFRSIQIKNMKWKLIMSIFDDYI